MFQQMRRIVLLLLLPALAGCSAPTATQSGIESLVLATATPAAAPATTSKGEITAVPNGTSAPIVPSMQWASAPPLTIDRSKIYVATFKTEKGDIAVELFADKTPVTVNNFVFLAQQGFYDNTTFHRVLSGFMAQGGDPTGIGSGGPGYKFADEFHLDLRFEEAGLLAMANSGPNSNGSQFFITYAPNPQLTGQFTIFGKVIDGMDVALALTPRDPNQHPTFTGDKLLTIEIREAAQSQLPPATATPIPLPPVPAAGRPLAKLDIAKRENLYTGYPAMVIDVSKTYSATVKTTKGDIVIELYPADAPLSVNNFVVLADLGYWDGFPINYTQAGEFVLTGSPGGAPSSDIGYVVPSEVKRPNTAGAVGYWYRADRFGSSASQIYFQTVDSATLDNTFTIFGAITSGLDIAASLTTSDTIQSITIAGQ